jgi:prepilin-type N-terminal cleavage/methylation domain-containing protein/prepilin-type processing-associated H-X9-DG protein
MTKNSLRGFTLFELLVVIAMVAILSTIAYPVFIGVLERGKALKDLNNLRQIGVVTQLYLNDNDGILFSATPSWMMQLHPTIVMKQNGAVEYLSSWNVFQSPLDTRPALEDDTNSPISYGINQNVADQSVPPGTRLFANKIVTPSVFILFAPAQDPAATVEFQGTASTAAPGVTVVGKGGSPPPPAPPLPAQARSVPPGGNATGGTHSSRKQINALFADWHVENMLWTTFTNTTASPSDASADLRWVPYTPYP